jgi:hypothetical protein
LDRLRIGGHTSTRAALDQLGFTGTACGLRMGVDRDGHPVTVRPFHAEPTRIALVGGYWAARLLVLRALATGARAVVVTRSPAPWQAFADWAVAGHDRVRVVPALVPHEAAARPHEPTLVVEDAGGLGGPMPLQAWQTLLTLVPRLTPETAPVLAEAQLVALQRLTADEATTATSALRLTAQTGSLVQRLEPDMLALLGGGADRYVWLSPTRTEIGHLGRPPG